MIIQDVAVAAAPVYGWPPGGKVPAPVNCKLVTIDFWPKCKSCLSHNAGL